MRGLILEQKGVLEGSLISHSVLYHLLSAPLPVTFKTLNSATKFWPSGIGLDLRARHTDHDDGGGFIPLHSGANIQNYLPTDEDEWSNGPQIVTSRKAQYPHTVWTKRKLQTDEWRISSDGGESPAQNAHNASHKSDNYSTSKPQVG